MCFLHWVFHLYSHQIIKFKGSLEPSINLSQNIEFIHDVNCKKAVPNSNKMYNVYVFLHDAYLISTERKLLRSDQESQIGKHSAISLYQ